MRALCYHHMLEDRARRLAAHKTLTNGHLHSAAAEQLALLVDEASDLQKLAALAAVFNKSVEVYEEWKALTRPAPGPDGLRRPLYMNRPLKPVEDAYRFPTM